MQDDQTLYKQAVQYYQSNDLGSAEKILRQILVSNPHHAQSLHVMGIIALDVQRYDIAEELVRSAVDNQDNNPSFYFTLGRILSKREKKEDAIKYYQKAISIKPDYVDALNNLGSVLMSAGRESEASEIFERLLKENPNNINALCNTASLYYNKGDYERSSDYYRRALVIQPNHAQIHYDLGRALKAMDRPEDALEHYQTACKINPEYLEAFLNIGDIYREKSDLDTAVSYYSKAKKIRLHEDPYAKLVTVYLEQNRYDMARIEAESAVQNLPESVQSLINLGLVYDKVSMFDEAYECFQRALTLDKNNADVYANMTTTLNNLGRLEESIATLKRAIEISPKPWIYNNLLFVMVYAASASPEDLAQMSREFGERIADPHIRQRPFTNDRDPDRKLRIGYVSPDFRKHAVSYFLCPIYKNDSRNFETFAYSNAEHEDSVTEKLKQHFTHWRNIKYLSDDAAADMIEKDKIDILVDIAGHTARNGLMIFARKPAPIQVTWMGYPATTGMKAMDYRITDSYAEPVGMTEHLNTETLWRLPKIFIAYAPHEHSPAVIDHPPFEDNGYITFGCFNNFSKVTDPVLKIWAQIMEKVPNSRLLLEINGIESEKLRKKIEERLIQNGLLLERVILESKKKSNQFILYNKIDIALDPFPCAGGTTSMDTLWMGVPFITLAGKHFGSRMGVTILENTGLPQLIAQDTDQYISIVTDLAGNPDKLRELRKGLRERFAASPAMDQENFAKDMQAAFRQMWAKWVASNP